MSREYKGDAIAIQYDLRRCIHAEECVLGIGSVFEKGGKPWIHPDGAPAAEVASVIQRCPTGALHYVATDTRLAELPATTNSVVTAPRGPLYFRGDLAISGVGAVEPVRDTRAALCRCGASANKPWCDGSHHRTEFADPGLAAPRGSDPAPLGTQAPLRATALPNGPLRLEGPVVVRNAAGEHIAVLNDVKLCRCGASEKKPFCDGSHKRIGFQDAP